MYIGPLSGKKRLVLSVEHQMVLIKYLCIRCIRHKLSDFHKNVLVFKISTYKYLLNAKFFEEYNSKYE